MRFPSVSAMDSSVFEFGHIHSYESQKSRPE